jgi:putative hemolysin
MKKFKIFLMILFVLATIGLVSCAASQPEAEDAVNIPNPASVFCKKNKGKLDFREDEQGGVQGFCLFADGSECEEWAYFRGECAPASQKTEDVESGEDTPAIPTEPVQAPEFSVEDYQGWWTYQNDTYGFSLMLPEDWVVEETITSDPLMSGHFLILHLRAQADEIMNIRLSVRQVGEETLLWPTGVGEGEFVPLGTLEVAGQLARRIGFQCPAGAVSAVWYQGPEETGSNIQITNLEFGFIASLGGETCKGEVNLEGKTARLADMIVASLEVP